MACQQILREDASVFSIQWLVIPEPHGAGVTARFLLDRYFSQVRSCTWSLIRPLTTVAGEVEFRLWTSSLSLLKFSPPEFYTVAECSGVDLRISGGILVQPEECERGRFSLTVEQVADGTRITLQLSDYCPLLLGNSRPSKLRKMLYRLTQAWIHKAVTVNFLASLHRELTGEEVRLQVKKVVVHEGEDT
jgi:hypothetical protein